MKQIIIILLFAIALAGCSSNGDEHTQNSSQEIYYCPMHPEVTSDKPGVCPICHMDLVKKNQNVSDKMEEGITFTKREVVLANVSTVKVKKEQITKKINAYSYLDFAENARKYITARFGGRVEKLHVNKTGDYIKKGAILFEVYSPELVQAQNDYLIALKSQERSSLSSSNLLTSSKNKLLLYGITEKQIAELEADKNIKLSLPYYSPYSGIVIEKKIQEGMYFNEGDMLYDVAELSRLWNIAEIYENDITNIRTGTTVTLSLPSFPAEQFKGTIDFIYPVVNPQSRTVKVRSVFNNSNGRLKPNMYGETLFYTNLGKWPTVPEDAVIVTGERNIVWVKIGETTFEGREVLVGAKFDNKYQILSGLDAGDEIVASGGYLIDSESQLKTGGSITSHQHGNQPEVMEMKTPITTKEKPILKTEKKKITAEIDKTRMEEVKDTIFNKFCPVLGNPISVTTATVKYKGKTIGFCCPGCDQEFLADPEKYMRNISADGQKFVEKQE